MDMVAPDPTFSACRYFSLTETFPVTAAHAVAGYAAATSWALGIMLGTAVLVTVLINADLRKTAQ
jgi:hypothetical protein